MFSFCPGTLSQEVEVEPKTWRRAVVACFCLHKNNLSSKKKLEHVLFLCFVVFILFLFQQHKNHLKTHLETIKHNKHHVPRAPKPSKTFFLVAKNQVFGR